MDINDIRSKLRGAGVCYVRNVASHDHVTSTKFEIDDEMSTAAAYHAVDAAEVVGFEIIETGSGYALWVASHDPESPAAFIAAYSAALDRLRS